MPLQRRHRVAWLVGLLAFAGVAIAIAVVLIDPSAIATRVKDRVLPQVSARLGRQVLVGEVRGEHS